MGLVWYHWCERVPFRLIVSGTPARSGPFYLCGGSPGLGCSCKRAATIAPVFLCSGDLARPRPLESNPLGTPVILCSVLFNAFIPKSEAHEDQTGASNGDKWKTWIRGGRG